MSDNDQRVMQLPFARKPFPHVLTAGQIALADWQVVKDAGYKTVINLRHPAEPGQEGQVEKLAELGLTYVNIPVAGPTALSRETVDTFAEAVESAEGPMVVHCGSSNRVGALFALKAAWKDGASNEDALEIGRNAGLTGMQPAVVGALSSG